MKTLAKETVYRYRLNMLEQDVEFAVTIRGTTKHLTEEQEETVAKNLGHIFQIALDTTIDVMNRITDKQEPCQKLDS